MTALAELKALSVSANATKAGHANGTNLPALIQTAELRVIELQALLKQIIAFHPSGGGDASNYSALQAVLAELA